MDFEYIIEGRFSLVFAPKLAPDCSFHKTGWIPLFRKRNLSIRQQLLQCRKLDAHAQHLHGLL